MTPADQYASESCRPDALKVSQQATSAGISCCSSMSTTDLARQHAQAEDKTFIWDWLRQSKQQTRDQDTAAGAAPQHSRTAGGAPVAQRPHTSRSTAATAPRRLTTQQVIQQLQQQLPKPTAQIAASVLSSWCSWLFGPSTNAAEVPIAALVGNLQGVA